MITSIRIRRLNGEYDITFPFKNGHCIIVGPNGAGKSTALQIMAYVLGRQWSYLEKQRFESVEVYSGEDCASISREACAAVAENRLGPSRFARIIQKLLENDQLDEFTTADLSKPDVMQLFRYLSSSTVDLRQAQKFAISTTRNKGATAEVAAFERKISSFGVPMTRYFPTSRRVEVELNKLASRVPEYMRDEMTRSLSKSVSTNYYDEVVRFGMEDIEQILREFELAVQEESRNKFNVMMTQLLKEMANQEAISITELREHNITSDQIRRVLLRIEEGVLSVDERDGIVAMITDMSKPQKGGGHPPFHKRWLSHFFVKLLNVDLELQRKEAPVMNLVNTLQKYLNPKTARYDIENYKFSILSTSDEDVKLKELSSGEKQLVSLLAMLEFSGKECNILIDEPELSLSVPWQSTVLEDVVRSSSCKQLIAVTHSPFIFENSLSDSVVDFIECIER
ncbi:MAG: hypothetical protein JG765_1527 [Cereibacter sp.]|nr:hypothetical protein [Cereibacter sp.]